MKEFTPNDIIAILKSEALARGSYKKLAFDIGIKPSNLSAIINGRDLAGERVIKFLGMERVTRYVIGRSK